MFKRGGVLYRNKRKNNNNSNNSSNNSNNNSNSNNRISEIIIEVQWKIINCKKIGDIITIGIKRDKKDKKVSEQEVNEQKVNEQKEEINPDKIDLEMGIIVDGEGVNAENMGEKKGLFSNWFN